MGTTNCIYCKGAFDPAHGEGDHVLPAAMGEFDGDVRFRGMCPTCNARVSQAEQQLLQCAPEGFLRQFALASLNRLASRRLRKRGIGSSHGAAGASPPKFTTEIADRTVLVSTSSMKPGNAEYVDQVVFRDEAGRDHQIRLWPNMRIEQLQERMRRAGVDSPTEAFLTCDDRMWEQYLALLHQLWPTATTEELPTMEAGVRRGQGRIKFTVTDHYFRAIAKIAFHYYLAHSRRRLRGDEQGFAALRQFIMEGGDHTRFFRRPGTTIVTPFDLGFSSARWCHVLAATEVQHVAEVRAQLFVGPGVISPVHHVCLGSLGTALIAPRSAWAHQFVYEPEGAPGKAGRVVEITPSAFRPGTSMVS